MTANIIRTRYRLQPDDLAGQRIDATITNVTIEGLESLTPVLHFDQIAKPMLLSPGDADDLARITQTAVLQEWIGRTVSIAPVETADGVRLAIFSSTQRTLPQPIPRPPHVESRLRQWRTILIVVLVLLIFLFVFLYENTGDSMNWLQSLSSPN